MQDRDISVNAERNLFYIADERCRDACTKKLVERLADRQLSRTVLAYIESSDSDSESGTLVDSGAFTEIVVSAANPIRAAAALLDRRIAGLPTSVVWDNSLSADQPLLAESAPHVEQIILSVTPPCGAAASLRNLLDLQQRLGSAAMVTDAAEAMYQSWLNCLVNFLHDPTKKVRSLELRCADDEITADMLYVLAWAAAFCEWQTQSYTGNKRDFRVSFANGVPAKLSADPLLQSGEIAIEYEAESGLHREIICEPPLEIRWEELLKKLLRIRDADPIRERTLVNIADFLDAMERASG